MKQEKTMRNLWALSLSALLLAGCVTTPTAPRVIERLPESAPANPPPPPLPTLTHADLVKLAKQGLSAESMVSRIKDSRTRLRLSAGDILTLKTQGVPLAVLDHLLDSDRLAAADDCTMQINQRDEEARQKLKQAVMEAEQLGWQHCQLSQPGFMFPGFRHFPYRR